MSGRAIVVIGADFAVVHEPDGRHHLYLKRPFEWIPSCDDVEALGLPAGACSALDAVARHVDRRRADQAAAEESLRARFDVPYSVSLSVIGCLEDIYEMVGSTWPKVVERLQRRDLKPQVKP